MTTKIALNIVLPPILVYLIHSIFIGLYATWPHFDVVTHTLGGAAIAWSSATILHANRVKAPKWLTFFIILGLVTGAATAWEFYEWLHDFHYHAIGTRYAYQLSITDTMGDYLCALIGGTLIAPFTLTQKLDKFS